MPRGATIGLTADGFWQTGILKDYPPAMCGARTESFRRGLEDLSRWSLNQTVYSDIGACIVRAAVLARNSESNGRSVKKKHYTDEDVNSWASIIAQHTYARHPPVPSFFLYGRYVLCSVFLVRLLLTSVSVLGGG